MSASAYILRPEDLTDEARTDCGKFTRQQTVWLGEHMGRDDRKAMETLATRRTGHAMVGDRDLAADVFDQITACLEKELGKLNEDDRTVYDAIPPPINTGSQQQGSTATGQSETKREPDPRTVVPYPTYVRRVVGPKDSDASSRN